MLPARCGAHFGLRSLQRIQEFLGTTSFGRPTLDAYDSKAAAKPGFHLAPIKKGQHPGGSLAGPAGLEPATPGFQGIWKSLGCSMAGVTPWSVTALWAS